MPSTISAQHYPLDKLVSMPLPDEPFFGERGGTEASFAPVNLVAADILTGSADPNPVLLHKSNHDQPNSVQRNFRMRIYFINHLGGGFANHLDIIEGTTVGQLFEEKVGGDPAVT